MMMGRITEHLVGRLGVVVQVLDELHHHARGGGDDAEKSAMPTVPMNA